MTGSGLRWIVDRRGELPGVGYQGMRPTCLSWAITTAHNQRRPGDHSIEYLHHRSRQYRHGVGSISAVSAAIALDGQPPEVQWPYDALADEALTPPMPPPSVAGPFGKARLRACSPDPATVLSELHAGYLPVIGLLVSVAFGQARHGLILETGPGVDGHAITVVGAAEYDGPPIPTLDQGDLLICVRNSWGPTWGINGAALIGPSAWSALVTDALVLDAG
jgi:hypothetical protein